MVVSAVLWPHFFNVASGNYDRFCNNCSVLTGRTSNL